MFKHPRITLIEDELELPSGKRTDYLLFDNESDFVTIICKRNNQILLQKEYSYPINQTIWQFPGGGVKQGETPSNAANRELMEESEYYADSLKLLCKYLINNRRSQAYMYVFLATKLEEKHQKLEHNDDFEKIENHWLPIAGINQLIISGQIVHTHVLSSWCLYQNSKYV